LNQKNSGGRTRPLGYLLTASPIEHQLTLRLPAEDWADLNTLTDAHKAPIATMARHLLKERITSSKANA
jgi:hypothetical protein